MKKKTFDIQNEHQNQEVQTLSSEQLPHKAVSDTRRVPFQRKSLIRIEMTTLPLFRSDNQANNTLQRRVFYRKPFLTRQGKLNKERLILEILSHL